MAQERLHLTDDGQVRLELRHPWRDGTTDIVFDPVEFLGRLEALVPRPARAPPRAAEMPNWVGWDDEAAVCTSSV